MFKKTIVLVSLIFILSGCGYTPYSYFDLKTLPDKLKVPQSPIIDSRIRGAGWNRYEELQFSFKLPGSLKFNEYIRTLDKMLIEKGWKPEEHQRPIIEAIDFYEWIKKGLDLQVSFSNEKDNEKIVNVSLFVRPSEHPPKDLEDSFSKKSYPF